MSDPSKLARALIPAGEYPASRLWREVVELLDWSSTQLLLANKYGGFDDLEPGECTTLIGFAASLELEKAVATGAIVIRIFDGLTFYEVPPAAVGASELSPVYPEVGDPKLLAMYTVLGATDWQSGRLIAKYAASKFRPAALKGFPLLTTAREARDLLKRLRMRLANLDATAAASESADWAPKPGEAMANWILNPVARAKAEASAEKQSLPAVARAFEALAERRWPASSIEATMRQTGQFTSLIRNKKSGIPNSHSLGHLSRPKSN